MQAYYRKDPIQMSYVVLIKLQDLHIQDLEQKRKQQTGTAILYG